MSYKYFKPEVGDQVEFLKVEDNDWDESCLTEGCLYLIVSERFGEVFFYDDAGDERSYPVAEFGADDYQFKIIPHRLEDV